VVEWHFNDVSAMEKYSNSPDWLVEPQCYYINEYHQIVLKKSAIKYGKTVFVLKLNNILSYLSDFYKIIPDNNDSNYVFISLDQFPMDYKLIFVVNDSDIEFYHDIQLRKLNYCIDCGKCEQVCPINQVKSNFSPIQHIRSEVEQNGYVQTEMCMGCGKCDNICPVGIHLSYYFLFYNKPKKWNEKYLNKALNIKSLSKYVFKFVK
jgi:ferredoxin